MITSYKTSINLKKIIFEIIKILKLYKVKIIKNYKNKNKIKVNADVGFNF